jgi:alpha-N-arabinofuranosidase
MINMQKIKVYPNYEIGDVNRNIYGHFSEIAFNNIPGGFYDPTSKFADEDGFRTDVIEALRQVKTPIIRFPGGNYVSNYHWERGIGPKEKRERVFEYAWGTEDDNQFGTVEFIEFCRKVGAEPLICVNMGSGTVDEAMNWVEFCNGTGNTKYANLRRSLGYDEPFNVKYWGLGNEMYGFWQCNHLNAEQYAHKAFQFAQGMKSVDKTIKLTAVGIETDQDWNMKVVEKLACTLDTAKKPLNFIDTLSAHHYSCYWDNAYSGSDYMQRMTISEFIHERTKMLRAAIEVATNDVNSPIKIAWDEWNLFGWVFDGVNEDSTYNLENAIVTASILNSFLRDINYIGLANYSTFVNINGAVSTHEDGLVKRPQFYVFELYGNQTGTKVVRTETCCDTFEAVLPHDYRALQNQRVVAQSDIKRVIPYLDCVSTYDKEQDILYIHLINKNPEKDYDVDISIMEHNISGEAEIFTIYNDSINAANTMNETNVSTTKKELGKADGNLTVKVLKHSVNLIKIKNSAK